MKRSVWMAASAAVALSVVPVGAAAAETDPAPAAEQAVPYTHLTLPTSA